MVSSAYTVKFGQKKYFESIFLHRFSDNENLGLISRTISGTIKVKLGIKE